MRILFLTTAHNSLSQRLLIELVDRGHPVRVRVVASGEAMIAAVATEQPDLILAPMLKIAIPEEVWTRHLCLIVHPGIVGDRGPSSLDWAITNREKLWGVTILEAAAEFDAGRVWASREFEVEDDSPTKSSLYRGAVTEAAVAGVLEAITAIESCGTATPPARSTPGASSAVRGCLRPPMRQADRAIDWMRDRTEAIVRKIRAADSAPGVLGTILGRSCFLFGAQAEERLQGPPGLVLARRDGAICIGTVDGAVWVSHLKAKGELDSSARVCEPSAVGIGCALCDAEVCVVAGIKLPATQVLGPLLVGVPELPVPIDAPEDHKTFREIVYAEEGDVGTLSFDFYNGAMSTSQCRRLREAFRHARSRPTRVIVLLGGRDFWSNGIHLSVIEADADPAEESWRNINAMDDLVGDILETTSHLVVSGMRGNAGAGGAILALAADRVYARSGIVLNPHYSSMGGLYGSEYWTYTLPRRVGWKRAHELTLSCRPIGTREAKEIGFLDDAFGTDAAAFEAEVRARAVRLARDPDFPELLQRKHDRRHEHEAAKPLARYRAEELERMRVNFFGPDPAYHAARRRFVFKGNPPQRVRDAATRDRREMVATS